jgi:peptidyl-prolyl cis-trans isomerase C
MLDAPTPISPDDRMDGGARRTGFGVRRATVVALLGLVGGLHAADPGAAMIQGPGGAAVSEASVQQELAFQPESLRRRYLNDEGALRTFIDELYRRSVLVDAAEQLSLSDTEQYRLERARLETLVAIAMDRKGNDLLADAPDLTEAAEESYLANQDRFRRPAQRRFRHILLSPTESGQDIEDLRKQADKLLDQLRSGVPFEDLARQYSDDAASAGAGGDLGWAARGKFVPAFEEAGFALAQPGDVSGVVETQFGLHLIELVETRDESILPFEEVREQLVRSARADWLKAELQAWHAELTDPAKATVDRARLDAFIQSVLDNQNPTEQQEP